MPDEASSPNGPQQIPATVPPSAEPLDVNFMGRPITPIPLAARALGLRRPVAMIAAVGRNGVIGRDGDLPWRLPSDMKFFKAWTMRKPIIMGRKQYQSVGKPLPNRENIILTRDHTFQAEGCAVLPTMPEALRYADDVADRLDAHEIMIIGGGEIYRLAMEYAARLYLTEVDLAPQGDVTFPTVDPTIWHEIARKPVHRGHRDDADASIVLYERR